MEEPQPRPALPGVVTAVPQVIAMPSRFAAQRAIDYANTPAALTLCGVDALALPTDEALMLAWAGGDLRAFEALYGRHRSRLYSFLLRQLRDGALADEMFQDVWQRVIAARASWQPDAAFTTWLFRIAHNRLNDHWRAARHRPVAPVDADERVAAIARNLHAGVDASDNSLRSGLFISRGAVDLAGQKEARDAVGLEGRAEGARIDIVVLDRITRLQDGRVL